MKHTVNKVVIAKRSALATAVAAVMGMTVAMPASAADTLEAALMGGKAGLDLRYRYETVEQENTKKDATASTLRTRLNYATGEYKGFTGFIEFDDVTAFGDIEYNDKTGLATAESSYSVIADPEGTEVNQANLTYSGFADTTVKLGRQRVILDNARFIGNVGWRQNEQTYDALTVANKSIADTTIVYGYVTNVNRIFGEASPDGDIDTKTHLINVSYSGLGFGTLTGYGYFLELVDKPSGSNSTTGLRFTGGTDVSEGVKALYTVEFATQGDYKEGASTIDADYSLLELGATASGVTVKAGIETLGADSSAFSTQLATAHAFNGWADTFLNTPGNGLVDTYVSVGGKAGGVKLLGVYHDFEADKGGATYGDEINLLAVKTFGKNYKGLIKYASYSSDDAAVTTSTDKLWLMAQATFK